MADHTLVANTVASTLPFNPGDRIIGAGFSLTFTAAGAVGGKWTLGTAADTNTFKVINMTGTGFLRIENVNMDFYGKLFWNNANFEIIATTQDVYLDYLGTDGGGLFYGTATAQLLTNLKVRTANGFKVYIRGIGGWVVAPAADASTSTWRCGLDAINDDGSFAEIWLVNAGGTTITYPNHAARFSSGGATQPLRGKIQMTNCGQVTAASVHQSAHFKMSLEFEKPKNTIGNASGLFTFVGTNPDPGVEREFVDTNSRYGSISVSGNASRLRLVNSSGIKFLQSSPSGVASGTTVVDTVLFMKGGTRAASSQADTWGLFGDKWSKGMCVMWNSNPQTWIEPHNTNALPAGQLDYEECYAISGSPTSEADFFHFPDSGPSFRPTGGTGTHWISNLRQLIVDLNSIGNPSGCVAAHGNPGHKIGFENVLGGGLDNTMGGNTFSFFISGAWQPGNTGFVAWAKGCTCYNRTQAAGDYGHFLAKYDETIFKGAAGPTSTATVTALKTILKSNAGASSTNIVNAAGHTLVDNGAWIRVTSFIAGGPAIDAARAITVITGANPALPNATTVTHAAWDAGAIMQDGQTYEIFVPNLVDASTVTDNDLININSGPVYNQLGADPQIVEGFARLAMTNHTSINARGRAFKNKVLSDYFHAFERNPFTFYQFLIDKGIVDDSAVTDWTSGVTYPEGAIVRRSVAGFFGGAMMYWRRLESNSGVAESAASAPNQTVMTNMATVVAHWEPAFFHWIGYHTFRGTRFSFNDTNLGVVNGTALECLHAYWKSGKARIDATADPSVAGQEAHVGAPITTRGAVPYYSGSAPSFGRRDRSRRIVNA